MNARQLLLPLAASVATAAFVVVESTSSDPGVSFSTSVNPTRVVHPGRHQVTYRIRMQTGATPERFGLSVSAPRYGHGRWREEGSPIHPLPFDRFLQISGPGEIDRMTFAQGVPACSPTKNAFHGYESTGHSFDVELPPESTTTLSLRYEIGGRRLWRGLRLSPDVIAGGRLSTGERATLRHQRIRVPAPRLQARRIGVRITLASHPRMSPNVLARVRGIRQGRPITIRGRTDPPVRKQRISLRYVGPSGSRFIPLATVKTNRRGRFRFRDWRPRHAGYYELWAFYRSQRRDLYSDHACPRAFLLRKTRDPSFTG